MFQNYFKTLRKNMFQLTSKNERHQQKFKKVTNNSKFEYFENFEILFFHSKNDVYVKILPMQCLALSHTLHFSLSLFTLSASHLP